MNSFASRGHGNGAAFTAAFVDDDGDLLRAITDVLETRDIHVLSFEEPVAVLAFLAAGGKVDLVVADYLMAPINGLSFVEMAARLRPDVPRMLMTAYPDLFTVVDAVNQGHVCQILLKPLDPASFVRSIHTELLVTAARNQRIEALRTALNHLSRNHLGSFPATVWPTTRPPSRTG